MFVDKKGVRNKLFIYCYRAKYHDEIINIKRKKDAYLYRCEH